MSRQAYNILILDELNKRVMESPDERFTQMLYNLDVTRGVGKLGYYEDNYNEESATTLKNIQNRLKRLSDDPSQMEKIS